MMTEKPCRCGESKKRFLIDIGPFFVGTCCLANGYNDLGEYVEGTPTKDDSETSEVQQNSSGVTLKKGRLMAMSLQELKHILSSFQVTFDSNITKKQLIEAILETQRSKQ